MPPEGALPVAALPPGPTGAEGPTPGRIRLTALSGTLASGLLIAAYFLLPWIVVPGPERPRVERAFAEGRAEIAPRDPDLAQKVKVLERQVADRGYLTGLDTFHFARTSWALNRRLLGDEPADRAEERPWQLRRAFLLGGVVLVVLPVGAGLLFLYFVLGRFRRASARALAVLVVLGCLGLAVTLGWIRAAEGLSIETYTGTGLKLALGCTVAQACAGLFGVTARNWWRVYAGSLATLAVLAVLAWAYVVRGATP